ncbi:MAG: epoxide hydrolase, partial [Actinomycetia bacterium]|nr:epoxide hydrolase [Actinomycetes bacterium]
MKPFQIEVPDAALEDLRRRLANTRWPEDECVDDWSQGMPLAYTRELAESWAGAHDWRGCDARLNPVAHLTTASD